MARPDRLFGAAIGSNDFNQTLLLTMIAGAIIGIDRGARGHAAVLRREQRTNSRAMTRWPRRSTTC